MHWTQDEKNMIESGKVKNLRLLRLAIDDYIKIKNELNPQNNMDIKWLCIASHMMGQIRGEDYATHKYSQDLANIFKLNMNGDVDLSSIFNMMAGD